MPDIDTTVLVDAIVEWAEALAYQRYLDRETAAMDYRQADTVTMPAAEAVGFARWTVAAALAGGDGSAAAEISGRLKAARDAGLDRADKAVRRLRAQASITASTATLEG